MSERNESRWTEMINASLRNICKPTFRDFADFYAPVTKDEVLTSIRRAAAMGRPLIDMDHGHHNLGDQMDSGVHGPHCPHPSRDCEAAMPMGMRAASPVEVLRERAKSLIREAAAVNKLADELNNMGLSQEAGQAFVALMQPHRFCF